MNHPRLWIKRALLGVIAIPFLLHLILFCFVMKHIYQDTHPERSIKVLIEDIENSRPSQDYPFLDKIHEEIRVIGVEHSLEAFQKNGKHVLAAIKESDIVLLENGPNYFTPLKEVAQKTGKKAVIIDNPSLFLVFLTICIPTMLQINATVKLLRGKNWKTMTILAICAWMFGFPGPYFYSGILQKPWLETLSLSYIEDGRTGLMIHRAREQCPPTKNQRCVLILGEAHARAWNKNPLRYAPDAPHMIFYRTVYKTLEKQ